MSPGHSLVITKRRVTTWWDAADVERLAVMDLVSTVKAAIDEKFAPFCSQWEC